MRRKSGIHHREPKHQPREPGPLPPGQTFPRAPTNSVANMESTGSTPREKLEHKLGLPRAADGQRCCHSSIVYLRVMLSSSTATVKRSPQIGHVMPGTVGWLPVITSTPASHSACGVYGRRVRRQPDGVCGCVLTSINRFSHAATTQMCSINTCGPRSSWLRDGLGQRAIRQAVCGSYAQRDPAQ